MKTSGFILCLFLCTTAFAGSVAVPRLPPSEYLDTEVSTNVVFSLPEKADMFTVELSLNATPTNNVQIAFGRASADGAFPSPEAELTLGWDCGKWFIQAPDARTRLEAEPSGTNLFKTVSLSLTLRSDGTVREATVTDGSTRLFADEPLVFSSATSWNMLEAVARGVGIHGETFAVTHTTYGTRLIWR